MKEVIQAMNQIEGNPEKTLKQTFEEIEEEIRRKRMSGDGRTNGNAGPQAVYEAAQLRLRGLGSSTIGRSFTSTTVAESHGEMQSNDNFQRNQPDLKITDFEFKALHPVFDLNPFKICSTNPDSDNKAVLWIEDHQQNLCMRASVSIEREK